MAETNQDGALVETTVRTADAYVSFRAVHASRGKITRAEPIAALAQFRIHLIGSFPELEDQLCTFAAPSSAGPSRRVGLRSRNPTVENASADVWISFYGDLAERSRAAMVEPRGQPVKP